MVINRYEEGSIRNTIASTKSFRPGHAGLVGPPLVLTIVFCFTLIMTHPKQFMDSQATGTNGNKSSLNDNSGSTSKLSPSDSSKTSSSKPSAPAGQPAPAAGPGSGSPAAGSAPGAVPALPANAGGVSAPTAPSLQNAGQNTGNLPLGGVVDTLDNTVDRTVHGLF
jgi:hypothetical protein